MSEYAKSVAEKEPVTLVSAQRSVHIENSLRNLTDFFSSDHSKLEIKGEFMPETASYELNVTKLLYSMSQHRENRIFSSTTRFPWVLWFVLSGQYFIFITTFALVTTTRMEAAVGSTLSWITAPIPAVLLFIYMKPFSSGLVNIASIFFLRF